MNFFHESENNSTESPAIVSGSEEPSASWLAGDVSSSNESSPESFYGDYSRSKIDSNRRNLLVHKAIVERAYRFIYDEVLSGETTAESDCAVGNYSLRNSCRASNLVTRYDRRSEEASVDGKEHFSSKTLFDGSSFIRSERANDQFWDEYLRMKRREDEISEPLDTGRLCLTIANQQDRENFKSRSSPRLYAHAMQNLEKLRWTKTRNRSELFLRNSRPFHRTSSCERESSDDFRPGENFAKPVSHRNNSISETLNFTEASRNHGRKFQSKNNFKKNSDHWNHRKRKSLSKKIPERLNYPTVDGRRKDEAILETVYPLKRISRSSKPRDGPNLVSKIRKIYSEEILVSNINSRASSMGNSFEKLCRLKKNKAVFSGIESSSSEDSFIIDVEEILQENLRGKNKRRFNVEAILLANRNKADSNVLESFREPWPNNSFSSRDRCTIDTQTTEVKLLGDIKKRIDEDFARNNLNELPKSSELSVVTGGNEFPKVISSRTRIFNRNEKNKSLGPDNTSNYIPTKTIDIDLKNASSIDSGQYFVDGIDSGVSTDFSRNENESDLSRNERYLEINTAGGSNAVESPISLEDENYSTKVTSFHYSPWNFDTGDDLTDEKVERAVQRFTEELIMCERRAVERGLIDDWRRGEPGKRKKLMKQGRYKSSESPRTGKTVLSPRGFSKASQSSSEEEYLENISPPSLCSMSDSDAENPLDI